MKEKSMKNNFSPSLVEIFFLQTFLFAFFLSAKTMEEKLNLTLSLCVLPRKIPLLSPFFTRQMFAGSFSGRKEEEEDR